MKIVIIFQIKIQEGDLNVGIMVNEQIYVNLIILLIGIFLIIIKMQKRCLYRKFVQILFMLFNFHFNYCIIVVGMWKMPYCKCWRTTKYDGTDINILLNLLNQNQKIILLLFCL